MEAVLEKIRCADGEEIERIRKAVLRRYDELFPDWEVRTVSLEKCADRNQQLDNIIGLLENLKE